MSLEDIIIKSSKDNSKAGIFNNASQHWNHNLFWKCMKPKGGGNIPSKLEKKIVKDFGGVEKFKDQFKQAGITQFGSGWCWLSLNNDKLVVTKTANAANPLIDYRNRRQLIDETNTWVPFLILMFGNIHITLIIEIEDLNI